MSDLTDIIKEAVREKLAEEKHHHGGGYESEMYKHPHGIVSIITLDDKKIGSVVMPKHVKGKVYRTTHDKSKKSANAVSYDAAINHVINSHEKHIINDMYEKTFPKKDEKKKKPSKKK
jgi:hypothetical protein